MSDKRYIDRVTRVVHIITPEHKFYAREAPFDSETCDALERINRLQDLLSRYLRAVYDAKGRGAALPEMPQELREQLEANAKPKQGEGTEQKEKQSQEE